MKKAFKISVIAILFFGSNVNAQTTSCATDVPTFNGLSSTSGSYISTTYTLGTSGTLEAWIYLNSLPQDGYPDEIISQSQSTGMVRTDFRVTNAGNIQMSNYTTSNTWFSITGSTTLSTNTWYHVAATWNSTSGFTAKLFVNGCLDNSSSSGLTWGTTSSTYFLTIGAWDRDVLQWHEGYEFDGQIDEVRVWDHAKTQCEIDSNLHHLVGSTSGLQCYYQFNESSLPSTTANSVSGSYTGTLHNISTWSTSNAPVISTNTFYSGCNPTYNYTHSLALNGTTQYVSTGQNGIVGSSGTFEAWIYLTSLNSNETSEIFSQSVSTGQLQTEFGVNPNGNLQISNYTNGSFVIATGGTSICLNTWYHVAATWNSPGTGFTTKLYVNGYLDNTSTSANTWQTTTFGPLVIGAWDQDLIHPWNLDYEFGGNINEARVWNVARTQSDIVANMNQAISSPPASLLAYYSFNNTANDLSGNSYNATLIGGPSYSNSLYAPFNFTCANGCKITGVNGYAISGDAFVLYPNPNNGTFVIETDEQIKQTVQVYNIAGEIVLTQSVLDGKAAINASILSEGIYNVCISSTKHMFSKRLVIVK